MVADRSLCGILVVVDARHEDGSMAVGLDLFRLLRPAAMQDSCAVTLGRLERRLEEPLDPAGAGAGREQRVEGRISPNDRSGIFVPVGTVELVQTVSAAIRSASVNRAAARLTAWVSSARRTSYTSRMSVVLSSVTRAPRYATCSASPTVSRYLIASRTGEMLIPSESASSSRRSGAPAGSSPTMIASRSTVTASVAMVALLRERVARSPTERRVAPSSSVRLMSQSVKSCNAAFATLPEDLIRYSLGDSASRRRDV